MFLATPQGWRALPVCLMCLLTMCVSSVSCQSTKGTTLSKPNHRGMQAPPAGLESGPRAVEQARKSIESGDTSNVIPRLLHVIGDAPTSNAAYDARYWLAVAYAKIGSYRDAIDMYNEYLRLAPDGKYEKQAKDEAAALGDEYRKKFETSEEMDAQVSALADQVRKDPKNSDLRMKLANTLWKRGDYESAAKIYYEVISENPALADNSEVQNRIERLPNGGFIVLTPAEIQRREVERQPLQVFNTTSFRSGKDLFTREALYYVVSGQVVNRGSSVLYGVEVAITIYGFGNMVYDTNTVHIGRMNPGEIRAFSSRFSNFDNIEEVQRYECVASDQ